MSHRLDSSTTDDALVHEIRRIGSETAFCLLYERHTPRLLQAAWRILGGAEHDAEDAVQESWVRAIGSLSAWRGESPFGAWVRGIVIHVAIDVLRRQRQFADQTDVEFSDDARDARLDLE